MIIEDASCGCENLSSYHCKFNSVKLMRERICIISELLHLSFFLQQFSLCQTPDFTIVKSAYPGRYSVPVQKSILSCKSVTSLKLEKINMFESVIDINYKIVQLNDFKCFKNESFLFFKIFFMTT